MSAMNLSFSETLIIKHEHPSLEGHFSNQPIVPGVVILDHTMRIWQQKSNKQIQAINNTKFVRLFPIDIQCTVEYKDSTANNSSHNSHNRKTTQKIDFLIRDDQHEIIAKGQFNYD